MQPTPTPTPAAAPDPSATDPVTNLVRTQRQNVGYGLLVLAVALLVITVLLGVKSTRLTVPAETKSEKDNPFQSLQVDKPEIKEPNKYDYILGAFGTGLGLLIAGSIGAYLLVALPKPTEREQRTEARVTILAIGGLLGTVLILLGGIYFYRWSDSLVAWLDKDETKQARWALYPLLMVLAGGGLVFLASQPARAEERNNTPIRRLVYGSNLGFATLLVLVLLVILNAAIGPRVPNKLDTTSTGFYTLSPQTQQLIKGLDQPIHAYAILQQGDPINQDTKRLLMSCQDANPSKFRVTFLSPSLNKNEIAKLRSDYPMAELSREGILLVMGDEGGAERKRHAFVRDDELVEIKPGQDGKPTLQFNGEPKLLRELLYLAENKQRPKIYFTQSSGELSIAGGQNADPRRSATVLKGYLEKNYFDVQPLTFTPAGPAKVPDDAAVIVVADPTSPIPPNGVAAITKFMNEKKGKLVVLAGAQSVDRKQLQIGLEPLLSTYGVGLSNRFLFANPVAQLGAYDNAQGITVQQVTITQAAVEAQNPIALGFNKLDRLAMLDCREVTTNRGAGPFQPLTVLASLPGRLTWQMKERPARPLDAVKEINDRIEGISKLAVPDAQKVKLISELETELDMSKDSRALAVLVSEGSTARVAVFGCGWFVSDEASTRASSRFGSQGATLWLDLMGSTLDWVRDRPTVTGVTEKPYTIYQFKPGYSEFRMLLVPLLMSLLIVLGLGAGVWVIRRK